MTSEHATPGDSGAAPGPAAPGRMAAAQRAGAGRPRGPATASAVVEQAKGAVMALTGCSAEAAHETLARRAEAGRRTLLDECRITLDALASPPGAARRSVSSPAPGPVPAGLRGVLAPPAEDRPGSAGSAGTDPSGRRERRLADLQRLGDLGWADWNLVTGEASWSGQVFAILGRDPAHGPVRLTGLSGLALPDDAPPLARAVRALTREGRPCDVPFRTRTSGGVRHLRIVAEAVTDSGGTPVEVHGFVQDLTARRRAELALVESERAMLTQHDVLLAERTLASRLQDALLPLPRGFVRPAGLRVEVAYLPAQAGVQVGGDWFSAIDLPGGDALFVVGDVAGHGVDAVATMAQLRFTAKGMVVTGSSPTDALTRLNALLLHSRGAHGTASMVLARYSPGRRRLVWAQAGHLPPLLLRGGEARFLDRPKGVLLGATTTPVFAEAECALEPGDRLLLYTDGLVERPPDSIDRGLERLARAAAAGGAGASGTLEPLLTALLPGDELRDDVCVLDIRVPDGPVRRP